MFAGSVAAVRPRGHTRRIILGTGLLIAAILAPATAYAGKPSAPEPWIALASVDGARSASATAPALGSWVVFDSSYPTNVKNPRIEVLCYQGGQLTFGMAGAADYSFQLGGAGSIWLWTAARPTVRPTCSTSASRRGCRPTTDSHQLASTPEPDREGFRGVE
jgi:hypothetical protein